METVSELPEYNVGSLINYIQRQPGLVGVTTEGAKLDAGLLPTLRIFTDREDFPLGKQIPQFFRTQAGHIMMVRIFLVPSGSKKIWQTT